MCTRFTSARANASGSSDDIFEAARHDIGLVPGRESQGATSPAAGWLVAHLAPKQVEASAGSASDERDFSRLMLGVGTVERKEILV
jgi:hypothetical protein